MELQVNARVQNSCAAHFLYIRQHLPEFLTSWKLAPHFWHSSDGPPFLPFFAGAPIPHSGQMTRRMSADFRDPDVPSVGVPSSGYERGLPEFWASVAEYVVTRIKFECGKWLRKDTFSVDHCI